MKRDRRRPAPPRSLARLLSRLGVCSRGEAARLCARGRVTVGGAPCLDAARAVDPSREAVLLDGRPLVARERITLALHKPEGPVTTLSDPEGRETVYHLLPELEGWVFAIGRLDAQTSGLLLFTNDAALADLVAGDRSRLEKRYEATVRGVPSDEALARLAAGVEVRLEDGSRYRTRPARAERLPSPPGASGRGRLALTIVEGKNRQVRRMCAALGHEVTALRRTRIGPIELGDLALGACRALSPAEVEALREAATLAAARSRR